MPRGGYNSGDTRSPRACYPGSLWNGSDDNRTGPPDFCALTGGLCPGDGSVWQSGQVTGERYVSLEYA